MSDTGDNNFDRPLSLLQRWSQRKHQQSNKSASAVSRNESTPISTEVSSNIFKQQDLPAVESLDENSEVSMFFSDRVSEALKRQALRRLFHMHKFNVCDGLDDYADDYTAFQPLGEIVTAYQQLRQEHEKLKQANNEVQDHHADKHPTEPDESETESATRQNPTNTDSADAAEQKEG